MPDHAHLDVLAKPLAGKATILALHGRGSNPAVTSLQLDALGLLSAAVSSLQAPTRADAPGIGVPTMQAEVFSWLPAPDKLAKLDRSACLDAICSALAEVLIELTLHGPRDIVYGFSQGCVIAHMVNALPQDERLLEALNERGVAIPWDAFHGHSVFRRGIFVCAAGFEDLVALRDRAGIGPLPAPASDFPNLHLIGMGDNFRAASERFCRAAQNAHTDVRYMPGGHEISLGPWDRSENPDGTRETVRNFVAAQEPVGPVDFTEIPTTQCSRRRMSPAVQFADVHLKTDRFPDTIIDALQRRPTAAAFLRNARTADPSIATTYGGLLEFLSAGGGGDLRRLGVRSGEPVGYVVPVGGNALSAAMFLTIAAQTCAVPLNPGLNAEDAALAMKQYKLRHVIITDGVACLGIETAVSANEEIALHRAFPLENGSPGLFGFHKEAENVGAGPPLSSSADDTVLLLRTSGTTSRPKVVPLRQIDLLHNACLLAEGVGLKPEDVTYSVMPLDHIGGISASLLATLVTGAAMTGDDAFTPGAMIEALANSRPQPTWYSAVPTISMATVAALQASDANLLDSDGRWSGHGLRMIRSGAATLSEAHKRSIETAFGCRVISTYSMSEQMPISQPSIGDGLQDLERTGVGVPVAASVVIIDPDTLRPLPYGRPGEICIRGSTVFPGYMDNDTANLEACVLLRADPVQPLASWFRTGDLGEMTADGTLFLRGRRKELIKRGGEQVSPFEVEAHLEQNPLLNMAVCFPAPSEIYGEEVACALVLSPRAKTMTEAEVIRQLRRDLRDRKLSAQKTPSVWRIVSPDQIPRTATGKITRNRCAEAFGLIAQHAAVAGVPGSSTSHVPVEPVVAVRAAKPIVDYSTIAGFRFVLACYVMFMHIGATGSWQAFSNLRQFKWHVHAFFAVAGFSLAIVMSPPIRKPLSFVGARILSFYPLYLVAVVFALANMLVTCTPSSFDPVFRWIGDVAGTGTGAKCWGTPLIQSSWWGNLGSTVFIHLTGLQASPLWPATWWMGFYLWFISMYIQCLVFFPFGYNTLYRSRGQAGKLVAITVGILALNYVILLVFWGIFSNYAHGYGLFDPLTGLRLQPGAEKVAAGGIENAIGLSFYLFAPFWAVYFVAGMAAAFIYDALRPAEGLRNYVWGYVADAATCLVIAFSVLQIAQGYIPAGVDSVSLQTYFMRPEAANALTDPSITNRIWDSIYPRLFAPLTLLWIFALATGQGLTARILQGRFVSQVLAPTAFGCFLFHQMVAQWYYAATRHGNWWNWWIDQKDFYWFSPKPLAVEWYEYFYIVGIVVLFARAIEPVDPLIRRFASRLIVWVKGSRDVVRDQTSLAAVVAAVQTITGLEVDPNDSLEECGVASLGVAQLIGMLEQSFSTKAAKVSLPIDAILRARTLYDVAALLDAARTAPTMILSRPETGAPANAI